jgi:hypothetical protein
MKDLKATTGPGAIHLQWFGDGEPAAGSGSGSEGAGSFLDDLSQHTGSASPAASPQGGQGGTDPASQQATDQGTEQLAGFWNAATKSLRGDSRFQTFAPKFKSFDEVVKSAMDLEGQIGSRVPIPTDKSSPEEIAEYHKKIGVPDNPEGYKLPADPKYPNDETSEKEFRASMHALNVPQSLAAALWKTTQEKSAAAIADFAGRQAEAVKSCDSTLKKDWGNDFRANVDTARRGLAAFDPSGDLFAAAKKTGMANEPAFLKLLCELGKTVREDSAAVRGSGGPTAPAAKGGFKYPGVK